MKSYKRMRSASLKLSSGEKKTAFDIKIRFRFAAIFKQLPGEKFSIPFVLLLLESVLIARRNVRRNSVRDVHKDDEELVLLMFIPLSVFIVHFKKATLKCYVGGVENI